MARTLKRVTTVASACLPFQRIDPRETNPLHSSLWDQRFSQDILFVPTMSGTSKRAESSTEAIAGHSKQVKSSAAPENERMLTTLLPHNAIMTRIFSFLPLLDRFRLRPVFNKHEALFCGRKVTVVYGFYNVEIQQAFQKVQEYMEFVGTPDSVTVQHGIPGCWHRVFGEIEELNNNDDLYRQVHPWYNEETGYYNVDELEQSLQRPDDDEDMEDIFEDDDDEPMGLLEGLRYVNTVRRENREKLNQLQTDVQALVASQAFHITLFDLMTKHGINTRPFLKARYPYRGQDILGGGYQIKRNGESEFLENLHPGRKLFFPDANGTPVEGILKRCGRCKKIDDTVQTEYCGNSIRDLNCIHRVSRCSGCSIKSTCSTCGITDLCNQDVCCAIVWCCVPGCKNEMCEPVKPTIVTPEQWDGRSCVFISPTYADKDYVTALREVYQSRMHYYCSVHKPEFAIEVPPMGLSMFRAVGGLPVFG